MHRCVSRSAALPTVTRGASAPPSTTSSWRLRSLAMLPSVTAANSRYVVSAEHRNEISVSMSTDRRNCMGLLPMQPHRLKLQSVASTSIWTSTSCDDVSARSGSNPPLRTISSRSFASVDRPRRPWTPRSCAAGSGDAAKATRGPRQPWSRISSWFAELLLRFAIAKQAALRICESWSSRSAARSSTMAAWTSWAWFARVAATLQSAKTA
mmetsp:Transcript_18748/g.65092  ORF Transcript_18748/g.65092 Transcript_18748/m.65092 type:complete len:210 (+) Transcript_18748:543-1172(+)